MPATAPLSMNRTPLETGTKVYATCFDGAEHVAYVIAFTADTVELKVPDAGSDYGLIRVPANTCYAV